MLMMKQISSCILCIQLQLLPDTIMQGKPALWSASDRVAMDIRRIEADMVFELGVDSSKAS